MTRRVFYGTNGFWSYRTVVVVLGTTFYVTHVVAGEAGNRAVSVTSLVVEMKASGQILPQDMILHSCQKEIDEHSK